MDKFAVVTDDFGNLVRYVDDDVEAGRDMLKFSLGDVVPEGAQIKIRDICQPYYKEENGEVFAFNTRKEDWIKLDKVPDLNFVFKYFSDKKDVIGFVDKKDWNWFHSK